MLLLSRSQVLRGLQMRSLPAILITFWLAGVVAWVCLRKTDPSDRQPTTSKMIEVRDIEKKLSEIMSFRTAIDDDFAQVVGVASFTTTTRIYPLHRHQNGDFYDSRGIDDFELEALDYDMSVACQPSNDQKYLFTIEILGRTEQRTSPQLVQNMKKAMIRRLALNFADELIFIQHYSDVQVKSVEESP
jgi:hypothetical protein